MPLRPERAAPTATFRPVVEMLLAGAIGAVIGWLYPSTGVSLKPLADLFLRAIQMLVAPLVFSTLVVGIAGAGDLRSVGRLGLKSLVYYQTAITLAIVIGLAAAAVFSPGAGFVLTQSAVPTGAAPSARGVDLLLHLVPTSIVDAMARGDILQIVVFATIFGAALATIGPTAKPVVDVLSVVSRTTFVIARLVARLAPIGILGAIAYAVGSQGSAAFAGYGRLILAAYAALGLLVATLVVAGTRYARVPLGTFIREIREPAVTAFATTSSEVVLPKVVDAVERLGVPRRVAGFVVPAGYSFNLNGTALYVAFATVFVAQASGVHLTYWNLLWIVLIVTLTSKGAAGIPRAAIVVLSVTLTAYGLPLEGVALVLGVDHVVDMARSATNVVGNAVAAIVVARWNGEFRVGAVSIESLQERAG